MTDAERAVALLRYANYAKVAAALDVSRAAVADWAKGVSVSPFRVRQLEQLLRPDEQVVDEDTPRWAGALLDYMGRLERRLAETETAPLAQGLEGLEERLSAKITENREAIADLVLDGVLAQVRAGRLVLPQPPASVASPGSADRKGTTRGATGRPRK